MVTMTDDVGTYHVYVVEGETISPREAGAKLAVFARIAVETGEAKDYGEGLRVACAQHRDLAVVYAGLADLVTIIGPQNKYEPPTGDDLLELRDPVRAARQYIADGLKLLEATPASFRALLAEDLAFQRSVVDSHGKRLVDVPTKFKRQRRRPGPHPGRPRKAGTMRPCLVCGRLRLSAGPHDRLHERCRERAEEGLV